jgi:hypothetical protein
MDLMSKFKKLELEFSLFDTRIDNVAIWERLRFGIYRDIQQANGQNQAHTSIALDSDDYLEGAKSWFKNIFYRNPFLTSKQDILFIGHPRRKQEPDGYWWDIYCDPIHEKCTLESVHFEKPYLLDHRTPAKTESLRYLELIEYGGTIQRKLGLHNIALPADARNRLEEIERTIEQRFDTEVNLTTRIVRELRNRRCRLWLYKRLLDRVRPELAVVVVSYGKETFIEACQSKGIPVVELQHGVIHSDHLGYSYSGSRTKEMFPDYLFTWGEFWGDRVEFPIPDERVIPVGYPYLEQRRNQYTDVASKDQILFISQGTIGEQLSKFAIEVDQHPDIDYNVVYKLHPGEYDRWREEYPWLVNADFEAIDGSEPPLYQLFAESSVQVGVGSTAVYEGLAFDLETYIYRCPGSEVLQPLVAENSAEIVSSVEELAGKLGTGAGRFDRDRYLAPDATEQVCAVLDDLRTIK